MRGDDSPDHASDRGHDPAAETYSTRHESGADESLTTTVVTAVTAVTNDDPTTIDPLYEAVDPDALEAVVRSLRESSGEAGGSIEFGFNGCRVTVDADGEIRIQYRRRDLST